MSNQKTQWAVIAVLVGMMAGPGALAAPEPGPAPKEAQSSATLEVKPGARKRVEVPGMSRVAVGDPSVADVEVKGSSTLEVKGVSEGKTTVIVWTRVGERHSYEVHVRK